MISSGGLRILILMTILIVTLFVPATADIIFPAKTYGFKISNTEDFPDYYIVAQSAGQGYRVISQDAYENDFANPVVYAVRKTDFNASGFTYAIPSYQFKVFYSDMPLEDVSGVYETYRIVSINTTSFDLERTERTFRYDNGSDISAGIGDPHHQHYNPMATYSPAGTTVTGSDNPTTVTRTLTTFPATLMPDATVPGTGNYQDSNDENPLVPYQYFLIPLLALCVIAVILLRRHHQ